MALALYRKYRPQIFAEFIGQEHIVQTITNALAFSQVAHAYLFSGPRGTGKTSLARLLAKAVNCQNRKQKEFEPCNNCSSCLDINQGRSVDLIEIDAASHRGIDEIRELRDGIRFVPTKSKYKVFIIDEAHQLTKEAFNALLKTLEEPPAHAIFVLATTQVHKLIPTIISRCQRFDFRKLTIPEIIKKLEIDAENEKINIQKQATELIARSARGSIRDAESLLDQAITFCGQREIGIQDIKDLLGLVEITHVADFVDLIIAKQTGKAISFLNEAVDAGLNLQEFAKTFINYLREGLILKIAPDQDPDHLGLTKEEIARLKDQVKNVEQQKILKMIETFLSASNKMRYSPIPQLPFELAIVEVTGKTTK